MLNLLEKEAFGSLRIDKVKHSDTKLWLQKLQTEDKKSFKELIHKRKKIKVESMIDGISGFLIFGERRSKPQNHAVPYGTL